MPSKALYLTIGVLLFGILPLPYGYYGLLRLVACGTFGWAAFIGFNCKQNWTPWICACFCITFNPFIEVHLDKGAWMIIDALAALTLYMSKNKILSDKD